MAKLVLISDVHYSLSTLDLADTAFRSAIRKAHELKVPLVDAGDITNDKAILRAEVMNTLIDTMKYANSLKVPVYLIVGNHSLINEKGKDHALNFLSPYVTIVDKLSMIPDTNVWFIPYRSDLEDLKKDLAIVPNDALLIMHQGVQGAFMGDYIQDKSAVTPELFGTRIVYSGHYHRHQIVGEWNSPGFVTYIGNPYTLSFGEANDPLKGYLIVNEDGSFTQEILELRSHIVTDQRLDSLDTVFARVEDLVWVKLRGIKSQLNAVDKVELGKKLLFGGVTDYRLDLIPDESDNEKITYITTNSEDILDQVIQASNESDEQKSKLKQLWRNLI